MLGDVVGWARKCGGGGEKWWGRKVAVELLKALEGGDMVVFEGAVKNLEGFECFETEGE